MKLEVANAIEELKQTFPYSKITCREDGNGGAEVVVEEVHIGDQFQPSSTWLGGHIPALYPYADIYPLFMSDDISRVDHTTFEAPITRGAIFFDRPAIQISRKNNQTQLYPQTASIKMLKVLDFLKKCNAQ